MFVLGWGGENGLSEGTLFNLGGELIRDHSIPKLMHDRSNVIILCKLFSRFCEGDFF